MAAKKQEDGALKRCSKSPQWSKILKKYNSEKSFYLPQRPKSRFWIEEWSWRGLAVELWIFSKNLWGKIGLPSYTHYIFIALFLQFLAHCIKTKWSKAKPKIQPAKRSKNLNPNVTYILWKYAKSLKNTILSFSFKSCLFKCLYWINAWKMCCSCLYITLLVQLENLKMSRRAMKINPHCSNPCCLRTCCIIGLRNRKE